MCALKRTIAETEDQGVDLAAVQEVSVHERDFLDALASLTPSLSQEELARYLALKAHYDARQGFPAT